MLASSAQASRPRAPRTPSAPVHSGLGENVGDGNRGPILFGTKSCMTCPLLVLAREVESSTVYDNLRIVGKFTSEPSVQHGRLPAHCKRLLDAMGMHDVCLSQVILLGVSRTRVSPRNAKDSPLERGRVSTFFSSTGQEGLDPENRVVRTIHPQCRRWIHVANWSPSLAYTRCRCTAGMYLRVNFEGLSHKPACFFWYIGGACGGQKIRQTPRDAD